MVVDRLVSVAVMAEFVVAATSPVPDWVIEAAGDLGVRFVVLSPLDADAVHAQLEDLRPNAYLLTWPDLGPFVGKEFADAAGDLRLVTYAGQSPESAFYTSNLDVAALQQRGIPLTTMPGAHLAVAEAALGFLLAFELDLVQRNAARKADPAAIDLPPRRRRGLVGSTLGIVGMGRIGWRVAELAVGCGMAVRYYSRTRKPEVEREFGASFHELPGLVATCDSVSLHLPMGSAEGAIDAHVLSHASELTLVNTSSIATLVEPVRSWKRSTATVLRGSVSRGGTARPTTRGCGATATTASCCSRPTAPTTRRTGTASAGRATSPPSTRSCVVRTFATRSGRSRVHSGPRVAGWSPGRRRDDGAVTVTS